MNEEKILEMMNSELITLIELYEGVNNVPTPLIEEAFRRFSCAVHNRDWLYETNTGKDYEIKESV